MAGTVLAHLGVSVDARWSLDTKDLKVRSHDPFDTVSPLLLPRSHESGIPSDVLGWTMAAPSGWTVLRGKMPAGGVNEWRGWSFTNEEFWTRTDDEQQRENGLRLRGVFAVADSDEFADRSGGDSFDSTLISPPFPVTRGPLGWARILFTTHYLQDGDQRGDVLVSFDGGPDKLVKQFSSDAKARVVDEVTSIPVGATTMRVKFHYYNAGNDWYWAVDDLRVISGI